MMAETLSSSRIKKKVRKMNKPKSVYYKQKEDTREYNLDLLRIVSMFLIVLQHALYFGGMYDIGYSMGGVNILSVCFTFFQSICVISTNTYVLISGYFLINERFRLSKLFKIVCEVLFYSWVILILFIYKNGLVGMDIKTLLPSVLPITYIGYWFVSAYIIMYCLMPVLNLLINRINRKQHFGIICILVCVFSVLTTLLPFSQIMGVGRWGQSVVWFVVLYIIGAFLKKYVNKYKYRKLSWKVLCSSILFMNFWWIITTGLADKMGFDILNNLRLQFLLKWYFSYDTIPVLFASISLFQLYRGFSISNVCVVRIVRNTTPLVFAVYLIHNNSILKDFVWQSLRNSDIQYTLLPLVVIGYSIAVFFICIAIDYVRYHMFAIVNKREWYRKMLKAWDANVYVCFDKLYELTFKEKMSINNLSGSIR